MAWRSLSPQNVYKRSGMVVIDRRWKNTGKNLGPDLRYMGLAKNVAFGPLVGILTIMLLFSKILFNLP